MSKSRWDSDFWKAVKALAAILTIVVSLLTILQLLGQVDVYNLLLVPIINFFMFPVPLISIPLAFLVVFIILFIWGSLSDSTPIQIRDPLEGADILDDDEIRAIAVLCNTPRTTDFLKKKYEEILYRLNITRAYSFEDCMKKLEDRKLVVFQNEKWQVTQKALDYIAKYHG